MNSPIGIAMVPVAAMSRLTAKQEDHQFSYRRGLDDVVGIQHDEMSERIHEKHP
ncbi:hypothetical protein [Candidatus Chloroploca sp. Khr17]|uniref:hypothetical protein n=1 Tax=Candidatus Chloroploca sp. Khr17 TaxID=2496869 RepID=UPI0013EB5A84|nr:hypothetical protein [Candidatus Chloroploca sp. Khr17]